MGMGVPGFRGVHHRAALRADPLAPSGLRPLPFNRVSGISSRIFSSSGSMPRSIQPPKLYLPPRPMRARAGQLQRIPMRSKQHASRTNPSFPPAVFSNAAHGPYLAASFGHHGERFGRGPQDGASGDSNQFAQSAKLLMKRSSINLLSGHGCVTAPPAISIDQNTSIWASGSAPRSSYAGITSS
jgi:hypothetical protein